MISLSPAAPNFCRILRRLVVLAGGALSLLAMALPAPAAEPPNPPAANLPAVIHVCDDDSEWPPFTMYRRQDGRKTGELAGFAIDVLQLVSQRTGLQFRVELLPWARCQALVKHGESHQMALNVSYNAERAKTYHLTRAYYTTTSRYYYSRKRFPQGLQVNGLADLKRHRACGISGYNYRTYGLGQDEVDFGAGNMAQLIRKLLAGRCDLFLEKHEIIAGFRIIDPEVRQLLDEGEVVGAVVPEVAETPFYMIVSRQMPQAEVLLHSLNTQLAELERSGELRRLLAKYVQ